MATLQGMAIREAQKAKQRRACEARPQGHSYKYITDRRDISEGRGSGHGPDGEIWDCTNCPAIIIMPFSNNRRKLTLGSLQRAQRQARILGDQGKE